MTRSSTRSTKCSASARFEVRGSEFLINGKPFYLTGFGKHEDTAVRAKGHDPVPSSRSRDLGVRRIVARMCGRFANDAKTDELIQEHVADGGKPEDWWKSWAGA